MRTATGLEWRSLCSSRDPKYMVKGTRLAQAIVPSTRSRFAIVQIRQINSFVYAVTDAETITIKQAMNGENPKTVATFNDEEKAIEYVKIKHG